MIETTDTLIDIFVVTYKPDFDAIRSQLKSIVSQVSKETCFALYIWDNSTEDATVRQLKNLVKEYRKEFYVQHVAAGEGNLGFGPANNRLLAMSTGPYILILNQEVILEPESIERLMSFAKGDEAAAAWELRQMPYEHPKEYDPVTLQTPWVSCAACLFRSSALKMVQGFEPRIFMYSEDVDLSWRLRGKGWKLRYVPQAAAVHNTYSYPGEIKQLQVIEGALTNLCLRARFGTWRDVIEGVVRFFGEIAKPETFSGKRRSFVTIFWKFVKRFSYFRCGQWTKNTYFKPTFIGWDYAVHREGAFYPFERRENSREYPLVSILVRTSNRPAWLKEALTSVRHQTYRNIEVVVVEDGQAVAEQMVLEEFAPKMNIQYHATGTRVGRSRAGNVALAKANGDWLNFLDDDDVLFADHVEVLLQSATGQDAEGAYGLAWETETFVISEEPLVYRELSQILRYRQPFCKVTLWQHNYMPIQCVLFNRSLYEKWGGLEEDMDQLEDWNLWTRYTLEHDFVFVEKCTSKYRLPSDTRLRQSRTERMEGAYHRALAKQKEMRISTNPRTICESIEAYKLEQSLPTTVREQIAADAERFTQSRWLLNQYRQLLAGWRRGKRWMFGKPTSSREK
jgi:GT2 family glycosyltransferase